MRGASIIDAIEFAEIRACHMRHRTPVVAHADVYRRLPEKNGLQLRVNISDVDERDISIGIELQQLVLRQRLLRSEPAPVSIGGTTQNGAGGHGCL